MRLPPLNLFSLQPDKVLRKVPNDRCGLAPRPSFVIKRYRAAAGAAGINVRAYILLSFLIGTVSKIFFCDISVSPGSLISFMCGFPFRRDLQPSELPGSK